VHVESKLVFFDLRTTKVDDGISEIKSDWVIFLKTAGTRWSRRIIHYRIKVIFPFSVFPEKVTR